MHKIAFIKFGGLASAGTEISFQNIAAKLSERFIVHYYYCDSAPYIGSDWVHPNTSLSRMKFLNETDVLLKKFEIQYKDITKPNHLWVGSNFWDLFDESNYSLIFSTGAGFPEYPFTEIKKTPIINIVTINGGVSNQKNILKTVLISEDSKQRWIKQGGDASRSLIIPPVREEFKRTNNNLRQKLNLHDKFVFGFHQREDNSIFSEIPLKAYNRVQSNKNYFLLLGGGENYRHQATQLNIENFLQLESSYEFEEIDKFLNTLNVFTHGRKHGETFGLVLTEAMSYGIPLITHKAESNAQTELVQSIGKSYSRYNYISYANEMKKFEKNKEYYALISSKTKNKFKLNYSSEIVFKKYFELISSILN